MINLLKILGFFGLFFIVILSCKKDEIELPPVPDMTETTAGYQCKTTPYSLIQPTYFPPYPTPILNIEMTEERIALGRKLFYETEIERRQHHVVRKLPQSEMMHLPIIRERNFR